jgi:Gram-negative porin
VSVLHLPSMGTVMARRVGHGQRGGRLPWLAVVLACVVATPEGMAALPLGGDKAGWKRSGSLVASGFYADLSGEEDQERGFAAYALTVERRFETSDGGSWGLAATLGSGDYERQGDRPGSGHRLTVSEFYGRWSGDWGRLRLGDDDGAAKRAVDLLPSVGLGQLDNDRLHKRDMALALSPLGRDSDDATKILYETPRLSGWRIGFSFAPRRRSLFEAIAVREPGPAEDDALEIGLGYQGDWRAFSYEVGFGYAQAQPHGDAGADSRSLKLAGAFAYGGFSVGAALASDRGPSRLAGLGGGRSLAGQASYANGPFAIALFGQRVTRAADGNGQAYGLGLAWRIKGDASLALDTGIRDGRRHRTASAQAKDADKAVPFIGVGATMKF